MVRCPSWMRGMLVIVMAILLVGCVWGPDASDPFVVIEGPYRVRLDSEPVPARVGEEVRLTATVWDLTTGARAEELIVRPEVALRPPGREPVVVPVGDVREGHPGVFGFTVPAEQEGLLHVRLELEQEGQVTAVSFLAIPVEP